MSTFSSASLFRFQILLPISLLVLCFLAKPVRGQDNHTTCGKRHISAFLIAKGATSKQGFWPWHAVIYHQPGNSLEFACGGSIINMKNILTAAHCLFLNGHLLHTDQVSVHAGVEHLHKFSTALQVLIVSELIIHPQFKITNFTDDIAIVRLTSDITVTQFVKPVCLWRTDVDQGNIEGKSGTIVGFGKNEHGELPGYLQEATLNVVDHHTCLENDRKAYGPILTRNMYCAGGQRGVSACNGDSGGGMYFEIDGTWYLRGLVSFIASRPNLVCDNSKFTVFTDISKYLDWIWKSINTGQPHPPPCTGAFSKDNMCNTSNRFDHAFLLVIGAKKIIRVPLNGRASSLVTEGVYANGIDCDCVEGRFYWSDPHGQKIFSANYEGLDQKPFIIKASTSPVSVAVDWISRRLYWADEGKQTIELASLANPNVRTVLISKNLVKPHGIAVDPVRGKLYWSDIDEKEPKIEWSNLDGTERQLLVKSPQVKSALSIQVSRDTGELCYTDGSDGKIECIDPHNKQIRTIASSLSSPTGLAIVDEQIYWTNHWGDLIESSNLNGMRQATISSPFFAGYLSQITAVTDKCPLSHSPCALNNGDCPENAICLVNSRVPLGRSCKSLVPPVFNDLTETPIFSRN